MSMKRFSSFLWAITCSVFLSLVFGLLSSAHACGQEVFGGSVSQLRQTLQAEFWRAKEIAWSVGALSRQETLQLSLVNDSSSTRNIWIENGRVHLTNYFITSTIHKAVLMGLFRYDASRFGRPEDIISFQNAVYEAGDNGFALDYYPTFIGLSDEECRIVLEDMTSIFGEGFLTLFAVDIFNFWFLHEIAHFKLGHQVQSVSSDSWQQEYAADIWALEVLLKFSDAEVFVARSEGYIESFVLFSGSNPMQKFAGTDSHPPISCRELIAIDYVKTVLNDAPSIDATSSARFVAGSFDIYRKYLVEENERFGVRC